MKIKNIEEKMSINNEKKKKHYGQEKMAAS